MFPPHANDLTNVGLSAERRRYNPKPLDLVRNLFACQFSEPYTNAARDEDVDVGYDSSELECSAKLETRGSPSRGLGLFATEHIPAYTKILEDYPLLSLAEGEDLPQLWQKYCLLPLESRTQFDELGCTGSQFSREETLTEKLIARGYSRDEAEKMARVSSRFQSNAFKNGPNSGGSQLSSNHTWAYGLFPTVARINHSCGPNAHSHYRSTSGARVVYSIRNIDAGEEIEISYFNITMPYIDRQERAKSWGFKCACNVCSQIRDPDRDQYERLLENVYLAIAVQPGVQDHYGYSQDLVAHLVHAIHLADSKVYPWLTLALPGLYQNLGERSQEVQQDRERVVKAFEDALEWECKLTGATSPSSNERRRRLKAYDTAG